MHFKFETAEIFDHIDSVGARLFTNEYTLAECIYKPSREDNFSLVEKYESLFEKEDEMQLLVWTARSPSGRRSQAATSV